MKLHTRWKRVYPHNIIDKRFFDSGQYSLGYFTILKAYKCKEYCSTARAPDGTCWFDKRMVVIRTDSGLVYKVPFTPWAAAIIDTDDGQKTLANCYNEYPW